MREYNRRGELTKTLLNQKSADDIKIQKFRNGKLKKTIYNPKKNNTASFIGKYPIVKHYMGQIGDNLMVLEIETEDSTIYNVNGVKMGKVEYSEYMEAYNAHIKSRRRAHFYQEFTSDSVLIYEGLFRKVDLPCGNYKSYYADGVTIEVLGYYDRRGQMHGIWRYFDESGLMNERIWYRHGKQIR
jgi:hypothetical protein